jgi:hypothetical protein
MGDESKAGGLLTWAGGFAMSRKFQIANFKLFALASHKLATKQS